MKHINILRAPNNDNSIMLSKRVNIESVESDKTSLFDINLY